MAILKNLIVNGASRFLQKAYFSDIEVTGSTTITDINAATLSVSGKSTLTGGTDLKGTIGIFGAKPKLDFHYNNATNATAYIQEDPSGTLKIYPNLAVTDGTTTLNQLIVNNASNFGGKVKIDGDVDIIGSLRWSTVGEHMTIQNLGGTLLVAPTIRQSSGTKIFINSISGNEVTMTISDSSIAGTDTVNNIFSAGGIDWKAGSLVKVSGKIGDCALGGCDGSIFTINLSSSQMTVKIIVSNSADLDQSKNSLDTAYTADQLTEFAVMMYKVNTNNVLYPVGLVLTSYGDNRMSYVDVYGGTSPAPVARMGNLGGLTYKDYSGTTATDVTLQNQWGFYTKENAYFQGHIETNSGTIGGWKITNYGLRKGDVGTGLCLIPQGSTELASIGGSENITGWAITSKNTFGVTTDGKLYLTSAKIAGWTIDADSIYSGTNKDSNGAGAVRLSTTNFSRTIDGISRSLLRLSIGSHFGVNRNGVLYANSVVLSGDITATSGKIGNWNISNGILSYTVNSTDTIGATGSAFLIPGGSSTAATIGGSSSISGWTFTSGSDFGVTNTGILYASQAVLSGNITATSGNIGGFTIDADSIFSGTKQNEADSQTGLTPSTDGDVRLSTANFSRAIGPKERTNLRFAIGSRFGVTQNGSLYISNAEADNFTAYRSYSIYGEPGSATYPNTGHSFNFVRAAAHMITDGNKNGTYRSLGIGPYFFDLNMYDGLWTEPIPAVGIRITRDAYNGMSRMDLAATSLHLHGNFTNVNNLRDWDLAFIQISGDIESSGYAMFSGNVTTGTNFLDLNGRTAIMSQIVSVGEIYSLTRNHLYMLITWHGSMNTAKVVWVFYGGATTYSRLNFAKSDTGQDITNLTVSLSLTADTVSFSSTSGNPTGRLIDLG